MTKGDARVPPRARVCMRALASGLQSVSEARQALEEIYARQLERAEEERTEANASVSGDGAARAAFLTLLPPAEQRRFFLQTVQRRAMWPRVRSLFGTPPYSFLKPEDANVLRATGIASNRVNMAHEAATATNYSEFGEGHFVDRVGRLYKVVAKERGGSREELPWRGLRAAGRVVADVRIKKTATSKKVGVLRGNDGPLALAALVFPRVGDRLRLRLVDVLSPPSGAGDLVATGQDDDAEDEELSVRVAVGRQKAANSPVARLVLDVE